MVSYLLKFNSLPKEIKDKVNAPAVMARVSELGLSYKVNLASTVMKVMVGDIKLENLSAYLINDLGLSAENARALEQQLRRTVFAEVLDYLLGASAGPKLVFSEADETEVRRQAKPLADSDFDAEIEKSVQTITEQSRVNFSDPLGSGKFRQVMKTYLRGTRDKFATMDSLVKPAELGGVALSRDTAERVLILASNFVSPSAPATPKAAAKIILPEEKAAAPASVKPLSTPIPDSSFQPAAPAAALAAGEYTLEASLKDQGKVIAPATPEKIYAKPAPANKSRLAPLDVDHELMPPVPAVVASAGVPAAMAATAVSAAISAIPEKPAIFQRKAASAPVATPAAPKRTATPRKAIKDIIERPPLDKEKLRSITAPLAPAVDNTLKSATGKIRMDDVRHTAHAESPIDELKNCTLVNFRRLDPDPLKAIVKIREKMENLGREEYARKIEAIVAWQQSPLNRLYLLVCRKSLEDNLPISAILEREAKKEPNFLRADELSAIISLNRSLKF